MKSVATSVALLGAAAVAGANPLLQHRAVCNADDCARAVTGTALVKPPLASRTADCSSFMLATVTPAAVTSTLTVTPAPVIVTAVTKVVSTAVAGGTTIFIGDSGTAPAKRQNSAGAVTNSPTAVPTYASACAGTSRYSSACSCGGITKSTTTAPTPTVTATTTLAAATSTVYTTQVGFTTVTAPLATATVVPGARPACGSTVQGAGPCECQYKVTCNALFTGGDLITSLNKLSETDCLNSCDRYDNCFSVDYSRSTGVCNIYRSTNGMQTVNNDDAYAFAGTCNFDEPPPNCIAG